MSICDPVWIVDQLHTLEDLYGRELPALLRAGLDAEMDLSKITKVYAIGNGDSCHAALAASALFRDWTDVQYVPMPAFPFVNLEMPALLRVGNRESTLVVGISASGSSKLVAGALRRLGECGAARTLSLSGKRDSALDEAAELRLSAAVEEKGRSPGLRTFSASLAALFALASAIGLARGTVKPRAVEALIEQIAQSAPGVGRTVEAALEVAPRAAALCKAPMLCAAGSGVCQAAAQFACAKIVEGSGVYASAQDLEEWNHVESMAYPFDYPVLLLGAPGPCLARAVALAETCKRVGHPVLAVVDQACDALNGLCDARFPIYAGCAEHAAALYYALPGAALAYALARQNGRAMFLSDANVKLF